MTKLNARKTLADKQKSQDDDYFIIDESQNLYEESNMTKMSSCYG